MTRAAAAVSLAVLLICSVLPAEAQLRTQVIATGLVNPVAFVMDPLDHSTFYVVEQRGTIRTSRIRRAGAGVLSRHSIDHSAGGERGLLGLAFPP
jgi:hypothetical protein